MVDFNKLTPGDKVVLVTDHGRIDLTRIYGRYKYRVAADCLAGPALGNVFTTDTRPGDLEVRLESARGLKERVLKLALLRP